jgi:hypothetical protein
MDKIYTGEFPIKEDIPEWLSTVARYAYPDIEDMEEVWGF